MNTANTITQPAIGINAKVITSRYFEWSNKQILKAMKGIWKIGTALTVLSLIVTALNGTSTKKATETGKKTMRTAKVKN